MAQVNLFLNCQGAERLNSPYSQRLQKNLKTVTLAHFTPPVSQSVWTPSVIFPVIRRLYVGTAV